MGLDAIGPLLHSRTSVLRLSDQPLLRTLGLVVVPAVVIAWCTVGILRPGFYGAGADHAARAAALEARASALEAQNQALRARIDRLKSDPELLRRESARRLLVGQPGTRIYRLGALPPAPSTTGAAALLPDDAP